MSREQRHLKLVVVNKNPTKRKTELELYEGGLLKEETSWWRKLSWHSKTQVFIFCVLIGAFVTGIALHLMEVSSIDTPLWMLASSCLFLIWILEYKKRTDSDPFNKPL